jgi:OOP family OmpA-OmpF porin
VTLDDLRPLIVGPEQDRIQRLEERLDHQMVDLVADVLPEAVTASRRKGDALGWAVEPLVEKSVREIVRRDPGTFAEAIAPAIGPAIRKAVSHALEVMLERLNAALDRSLSVQSLRWRVEAQRTGRSFAEVALLRTLVYRIEQVFLIHRSTGLLLQHLVAEDVAAEDPDQIAAMLSAIERFAHEAFREDARLERFRVGELGCWIEHGPSALLVAVVRGTAPADYETVLREALERTHLEYVQALADFRGDPAQFAGARELLLDCLRERRRAPRRKWLAPAVLLAILAVVVGLVAGAWWRAHRRFAAYADALRDEPGLVVTTAEPRTRGYVFAGLRDPLAADPATVLAQRGLDPGRATLRFEPFYSLDHRIVARRAASILRPPAGVSLAFHGGTLEARGLASKRWIEDARRSATTLPGVTAFAGEHLYAEETAARVRAVAAALGRAELLFPLGSARLPAEHRALLEGAAADARELLALAPEAGMTARLEVLGYTDPTGPEALNQSLGMARADRVAAELGARGVAAERLGVRGAGVRAEVLAPGCDQPVRRTGCEATYRRARSVVLRVALDAARDG